MAGRHDEIERICQAAMDRGPAERAAFVAEACGTDGDLRREVDSLLARESAAGQFMETPFLRPQLQQHSLGVDDDAPSWTSPATSGPALAAGHRFGQYEIRAVIGAGGMGHVYRAHDTVLHRDVALKVLPDAFARDVDRFARFQREARVLAALNHPNISTIHGCEEASGLQALVLELAEGTTLFDRIARGPLRLDEAIPIARQIADALEAAHEKGIIHRDLKPANVNVRSDGMVKVLDFGLAKILEARPAEAGLSLMLTAPTSTPGMLLGTAAYMSPEQARGGEVDRRTDSWAFGCILFEMLTGRPPFEGATLAEILAAVLKTEPDWHLLPAATPEAVRRLLRRCLQKDAKHRLSGIGDSRLDLDDARSEPLAPVPTVTRFRRIGSAFLAALGVIVLVSLAIRAWPSGQIPPEARFDVATPPTREPGAFAFSPDGRTLAFVATSEGRSRLWVRSIETDDTRALAGTDGARSPFWSADSRSIAFFSDRTLRRIDISGGAVLTLLADAGSGQGGAWNANGTILFVPVLSVASSVMRIARPGDEPAAIASTTGVSPAHPQFLPDGRHFLYAAGPSNRPGIYVGELDGPQRTRLLDATYAEYVRSGHLLFVRDRTLFAQPFDSRRLELTGSPSQIAENILTFSASADGSLAYRAGQDLAPQLVWFDRSGKALGRASGPGAAPSMAPDGNRVAVVRGLGITSRERGQDVWLLDLSRDVFTRVTVGPGARNSPLWSPDGRRIAFASIGGGGMYATAANGGGAETLLVEAAQPVIPMDWSPDGQFLLYRITGAKTGFDLWMLSLSDGRRSAVLQTEFAEPEAQFSPDGKWFAYQSNESGRAEIYVRPFPDFARERIGPISSNGGTQVRWRRDGKELFYVGSDNSLMAVSVTADAVGRQLTAERSVPLFRVTLGGAAGGTHQYAVSHDGQRFLFNSTEEVTSPLTVILNWTHRLSRPDPYSH